MDEFTLVLNAGSSSLKFAVYRRATGVDWSVAARGQVDGIGLASARLSVKDGTGSPLTAAHSAAELGDGPAALAHVAEWLRAAPSCGQ